MYKSIPLIIFGALGHQREVYYLIKQINEASKHLKYDILGFIEKNSDEVDNHVCENKKVIASDNNLLELIKKHDEVVAVISQGNAKIKEKIYNRIKKYEHIVFTNLIHPNVICDDDAVELGEGNIIAAGSILAANLSIGSFNLINRSCNVGHDVKIGDYTTLNPNVTISGNVSIGKGCLIGASATILQGLHIADDVTIGAGAVLTQNAERGITYVGVPAKPIYEVNR